MHYQHLKNFLTNRVRKNDIFVPTMILYLIKNDGKGSIEEISRLMYIFDYKHAISHYETIVEKFTSVMLEEYNLITKENDNYKLLTWPLNRDEIDEITLECAKVANGFFKNLKIEERVS